MNVSSIFPPDVSVAVVDENELSQGVYAVGVALGGERAGSVLFLERFPMHHPL